MMNILVFAHLGIVAQILLCVHYFFKKTDDLIHPAGFNFWEEVMMVMNGRNIACLCVSSVYMSVNARMYLCVMCREWHLGIKGDVKGKDGGGGNC